MKIVLGCMEFGRRLSESDSKKMTEIFLEQSKELDTAYMYAEGESEKILGIYKNLIDRHGGLISTKINPNDKGFVPEIFESRFKTSLERLCIDYVDILYLHWPCKELPIEALLKRVDVLHKKGYFKRFGISNYPSWEVANIVNICDREGYVRPTIYQGMYNCLTRDVERELFPCLREYNISFYAYNPLAGGLLTGRYKFEDKQKFNDSTSCRFHGLGKVSCKMYQDRFWHKSYFEAVECISKTLPPGRTLLQTSYDWLLHHSKLSSSHGDAIVIGASTLDQFEENMSAVLNSKELSEDLLREIDMSYSKISGCVPSYFR